MGTRKPADDDTGPPPLVPAGVTAVLALGTAALALIGLSGGVLVRAVRSLPGTIVVVLVVVVVLAFVAETVGRGRPRAVFGAGIVLAVLTLLALGATSIDERDEPALSLKAVSRPATATDPGAWTVTVKATASGLRPRDDMLVQVQALDDEMPRDSSAYDAVREGCTQTALRTVGAELQAADRDRPFATPAGDLVLWAQAGPSSDGSAVVESSVELPRTGYQSVCVSAIYAESRVYGLEALFDVFQRLLDIPTGTEPKWSLGFVDLT